MYTSFTCFVQAPITVTADKGTVDYILRYAEVEVVVCAPSVLGLLLSLTGSGKGSPLSTIIVMDQLGQEVSDLCTLQRRLCVYVSDSQ